MVTDKVTPPAPSRQRFVVIVRRAKGDPRPSYCMTAELCGTAVVRITHLFTPRAA